jgi:signal transduction histidine kinase
MKHIDTDSRILRNIMFNLISNASKYSEPGKSIDIICEQTKGEVLFKIQDHGIGIPREDQKHLFDRFYRASNAGQIQGTGLGLNIVKRYVELLGGEISFKSDYGQGSTFYVSIPY